MALKIYCEHGALSADLRAWQKDGIIELVHYPYDPDSRARAIKRSAIASATKWSDLNGAWDDLTGTEAWDRLNGSPHLAEILRIIGAGNRRDALHVDSAYKSGCAAIVTVDRDILDHKEALEALLGLRIFHPEIDGEELHTMIRHRCGR
jgi:hypothetical protein